LQAFYKLPTYLAPIIAGQGSGASLAYALVAQAPSTTFGGLLTSGFCPQLPLHKPLCKGAGIHFKTTPPPASAALARSAVGAKPMLTLLPAAQLPVAWQALASGASACSPGTARRFVAQVGQATWVASIDGNPPLAAAYAELALHNNATVAPPPPDLADLPIVEVPVEAAGPRFAVLVSGDGGWAGIDKELGAALAARGIPVAGIDSLRYFWTPRTPAGLAGDLDRVIAYYAHHWQRSEVLLIGYSQGADVLPFAINRLAPATREKVKLHALLSLGQKAAFEFHVSNWLGPSGEEPILPEAAKLDAADTLCVYGERETDALCPELKPGHAQVQALPGGHHYDGDYAGLADLILKHAPPTR
jgi:type IV secretory pathway VirJ component